VVFGGVVVALFFVALVWWTPNSIDEIGHEHGVFAASLPNAIEMKERADLDDLVLERAGAQRRPGIERASEAERPAPIDSQQSSSSYGLVLDVEGQPVPGVAIAHRHDPKSPIATTSGDGSFPLADPGIELVVIDPRWSTLRDTEPLERNGRRVILVLVAPSLSIGGRVQDSNGLGIEGAEVALEIPAASFAAFSEPLDRARATRTTRTTTDPQGAFEFVIPSMPRARLDVSKHGYAGTSISAPTTERYDLEILLGATTARVSRVIRGMVVHQDATPAASAIVRFGEDSTTTDVEGQFALALQQEPSDPVPLVAAKRGFQAAIEPNFTAFVNSCVGPLPEQRLVLGPPPLAIEGRVVDHEGRPKIGWIVQPVDPLLIRDGLIPPECVEALALGTAVRATSGGDGSFRLEGLQERAYRLQAHSGQELTRIESEPFAAGTRNVRLVVPADARFSKVEGRVIAHDGSGIASVRVRAALIVFRTKWGYTTEHSEGVMTDTDGRFTLANVPRSSSKLHVDSDFVLPVEHLLDAHVDGDFVIITAARRCHMRVEGVPPNANVDAVEVLDASGSILSLVQFQSGGMMTSPQVSLIEGASPVFAVAETARTIVFRGQGQPGVSRALVLRPGEITVVRW